MKRYLQLTFASLIAVLSFVAVASQPTSAIKVFDAACDTGTSSTTGTGASAGQGVGQQSGSATTPAGGTAATDGTTGTSGSGSSNSICGAAKQDDAQNIVKNVINTILVVLGMAAVVMIIIGGIRYTTSNGDASSIKGAKDTILYAVIGLVVAILAYAIVNFVIGRFS